MKAALFGQVSPSTTQQTISRQRPFQRIPGTSQVIEALIALTTQAQGGRK